MSTPTGTPASTLPASAIDPTIEPSTEPDRTDGKPQQKRKRGRPRKYPDIEGDASDGGGITRPDLPSPVGSGGHKDLVVTSKPQRQRQRQQNRVAASRYRSKVQIEAKDLEEAVREVGAQNKELVERAKQLREEVLNLKTELLKHGACGDPGIQEHLSEMARGVQMGYPGPES